MQQQQRGLLEAFYSLSTGGRPTEGTIRARTIAFAFWFALKYAHGPTGFLTLEVDSGTVARDAGMARKSADRWLDRCVDVGLLDRTREAVRHPNPAKRQKAMYAVALDWGLSRPAEPEPEAARAKSEGHVYAGA